MHAIADVQPVLKALDVDSSIFARWLQQLVSQFDTPKVVVLAKSLAQLASSGEPASIISTPTAAHEVARRTSEGWVYQGV